MKIIDISWPITENITSYKDQRTVDLKFIKNFENDVALRESIIKLGSHTGTHIDSPSHFIKNGDTVDKIPLGRLVGPCKVLDLTDVQEKITHKDLEEHEINKDDIILLKTRNSNYFSEDKFDYNFIYLDIFAANYLVDKQIKSVGIDYLGIERNQAGHQTHMAFFEKNICVIEGLRLNEVYPGKYFLYCLPLKVVGLEAVPVRAILIL